MTSGSTQRNDILTSPLSLCDPETPHYFLVLLTESLVLKLSGYAAYSRRPDLRPHEERQTDLESIVSTTGQVQTRSTLSCSGCKMVA